MTQVHVLFFCTIAAAVVASRSFVKAGTRLLSTMTDALKTHGVVPDVIDNLPKDVLSVTYPGDLSVDIGKEFTPTQVKDKPSVKWVADSSAFYTLCMTGEINNILFH